MVFLLEVNFIHNFSYLYIKDNNKHFFIIESRSQILLLTCIYYILYINYFYAIPHNHVQLFCLLTQHEIKKRSIANLVKFFGYHKNPLNPCNSKSRFFSYYCYSNIWICLVVLMTCSNNKDQ